MIGYHNRRTNMIFIKYNKTYIIEKARLSDEICINLEPIKSKEAGR